MCCTAAAAVFQDGGSFKRAFHYFAAVTYVRFVYRAIHVGTQPFLALPLAFYVLEAGDQAPRQTQRRVEFLPCDSDLIFQLLQAVKGVAV